ncbi:MAG: VCBS repeat-containing protein [Phycisphaerae bacterium]|nr:VCBS repeat-containing protein [Phycisphaerae bacterium]
MDGDGDLDFVQAEADHPDGRVAWFENDGKGNWTRHIIKDRGDKQDFHSLIVADFDLDGDLDVFSGGGPLSAKGSHKCYIWENTAGQGKRPTSDKWNEHIIAHKPCHEAVGADVDGDGDIDICSKPWSTGNEHFYLQNLLR